MVSIKHTRKKSKKDTNCKEKFFFVCFLVLVIRHFLSFFVHDFFSHFFFSTYLYLAYKYLFTNYTFVNAFLALRPKNAPFPKNDLKKCLLHPLLWRQQPDCPLTVPCEERHRGRSWGRRGHHALQQTWGWLFARRLTEGGLCARRLTEDCARRLTEGCARRLTEGCLCARRRTEGWLTFLSVWTVFPLRGIAA